MAFNFRKFLEGINLVPKAVSTVDSAGDLDVTNDGVLHYHNGTVSSPLVTDASSGNLTNKTYSSGAADVAQSGVFRMGNGEAVAWRNSADNADLSLIATASNSLEFNGNTLLTATGALVPNRAVITDGGAALTSSPTSAAEIAQVQGLTSPAVGTTQAQTLTNKTLTAPVINGGTANLNDTTTFIRNTVDLTKQAKFDSSAISTATIRTFAFPNANTTLVGTDVTQTLTNKDVRIVPVTKTVANNNQTLTIDEYVLLLDASGGAFNLILPLGLTVPGKVYYFKKIDSTLNAITIFGDTGNPDTIDGQPSTSLNTQYEALEIVCGSALDPNWSILDRRIPSVWTDYSLTIGATVTPPTPGTNTYKASFQRLGNSVRLRFVFSQTSSAGATAGSGTYLFPLPSGLTIDTSLCPVSNSGFDIVGPAKISNNPSGVGASSVAGSCIALDSTNIAIIASSISSGNLQDTMPGVSSAFFNLNSSATISYAFQAIVPIVGWKG